jgi:hypothetical protein
MQLAAAAAAAPSTARVDKGGFLGFLFQEKILKSGF